MKKQNYNLLVILIFAVTFLITSFGFFKADYLNQINKLSIKEYYNEKIKNNLITDNIFLCSEMFGLEPELILSLMYYESKFDEKAINENNKNGTIDVGLMQLNSNTFKDISIKELYDAETNILLGSKHLRELLDKYSGNEIKTLCVYNCGRINNIPEKTIDYVNKILKYKNDLKIEYHRYLLK